MDFMGSIKKLIDVGRDLKNVEMQQQLLEIQQHVFDVETENLELRKQLEEKDEFAALRKQIVVWDGLYAFSEQVEGRHRGPYCQQCLDADSVWSQLTRHVRVHGGPTSFLCQRCGKRHHPESEQGPRRQTRPNQAQTFKTWADIEVPRE